MQIGDQAAIAALTTTGFGRNFLTLADANAALTYIQAQPLDVRLRDGGDRAGLLHHPLEPVSIHASVMEATRIAPCPMFRGLSFDPRLRDGGDCQPIHAPTTPPCFDPRLRDGGDCILTEGACELQGFDPRLRDGGDPGSAFGPARCSCFDPRLRDGGDSLRNGAVNTAGVSIHASVMEATTCPGSLGRCTVFRSTPP